MLRIDRNHTAAAPVEVLRLEGKVVGRWVEELRRSCSEILDRPGARLVLDLAEVSFIDMNGLALFRDLPPERVSVENCSPFTAEQLRQLAGRR